MMAPARRLTANLLLLVGSSVLSMLVMEGLVRVTSPSDRLEFLTDDELLWALEPDQVGTVAVGARGTSLPLATIDRRGFRASSSSPPTASLPRVLTLGDSFAFGHGVADHETFSALVQERSRGRLAVVNAAVPGYGVFQELSLLKRIVDDVVPRFVVVTVVEGDILRQPFATATQKVSFLRQSRWRQRLRRTSRLATVVARSLQRVSLASTGRAVVNARVSPGTDAAPDSTVFQACWRDDRSRLVMMRDLAASKGAALILVAWPQRTNDTAFFLTEMRRLAADARIPLVDLSEPLSRHSDDALRIAGDGHPTALAHAVVAEEVLRALTDLGAGAVGGSAVP